MELFACGYAPINCMPHSPPPLLLGQTRGLDLVQVSIANPSPGSLGSTQRIGLSVHKMKIAIVYAYNIHCKAFHED